MAYLWILRTCITPCKLSVLSRVRDFLEQRLVRFQSSAGIAVSDFLRILELYLQSTAIYIDGDLYIQKTGICIGSSIAPMLSEIYLRTIDDAVVSFVSAFRSPFVLVKRFVDDLLLLSCDDKGFINECHNEIVAAAPELVFTVEHPTDNCLQYLDLRILFNEGLCWSYGKVKPKPVLSASSCHSKSVKSGVVSGLLSNAVKKSCVHNLSSSISHQLARLNDAGYSQCMQLRGLNIISAKLLSPVSDFVKPRENRVVIPYIHAVSHNLLHIARKFNINLVFRNNFRLDALTPFGKSTASCKNHRRRFVPCTSNIVYEIPFKCGFCYIGQSKRCLNDRLREHALNVKNKDRVSEVAKHARVCHNCEPLWSQTTVLAREADLHKRLLRETLFILGHGNCVSQTTLTLSPALRELLALPLSPT